MDFEGIQIDFDEESSTERLKEIRKSFEAGGTKLWGAKFDPDEDDSDSEMNSLTPIREQDDESGEELGTPPTDANSCIEGSSSVNNSTAASPGPIRARQTEFRSTLIKHKQLWQRAAKQANKERRRSILPIDDITNAANSNWRADSTTSEEDEEENPPPPTTTTEAQPTTRFQVKVVSSEGLHPTPSVHTLLHSHSRVLPVTSLDIERNVKPRLQPVTSSLGFTFPRFPMSFTTDVSETLYQKYYGNKKRMTIVRLNLLYIGLLIFLLFVKLLPFPQQQHPINKDYVIREVVLTVVYIVAHAIVSFYLAKKANSATKVTVCAVVTFVILLVQTQISTVTSYIDFKSVYSETSVLRTWEQFGTWQTSLALFTSLVFLTVIPYCTTILLGAAMSLIHLLLVAILNALDSPACLSRVGIDLLILLSIYLSGLFNNFMVERTERKAFLEIRTCIESRHTIAKQNQNQERLVLSVLPKFIVNDILRDSDGPQGAFFNMYLHEYKGVSILFADICGFTTLGSQLSAKGLVNMLNGLFANFDKLAKRHKCLRIKLLGDCYECVCGIPDEQANHADNCVEMGLDMIDAIRQVREQQRVEVLDMRIGVHTGSVFCGVLGLRKWQFDIYSDDVKTANHMESSGQKGRVHISEKTLENLTHKFDVEENTTLDNEYLKQLKFKTYFIKPPQPPAVTDNGAGATAAETNRPPLLERRFTLNSLEGQDVLVGNEPESRMPSQLRHSTDNAVNNMLERATDSKADNRLMNEFVHPVLLSYKDCSIEVKYRQCRDEAFQTNIVSFTLMTITVVAMQAVSNQHMHYMSFVAPLLTSTVPLASFACLTCIILVRLFTLYKSKREINKIVDEYSRRQSLISERHNYKTMTIPGSYWLRNIIITTLVLVLFGFTLCQPIYMKAYNISHSVNGCFNSYLWLSWMVVMLSTISFLKWTYIIKVIMISLMCIGYIIVHETTADVSIKHQYYTILNSNDTASEKSSLDGHLIMYGRLEYIIVLVFTALLLIYHSRVLERHSRLDFLWRLQAKQELEEMDVLRENNLTLLRNILPEHVAKHYLGRTRRDEELYCESYDNVAVMFASISNFNDFWLAVPGNENGKGCLMILNEIIADFDELLGQPAFVEVEKIKTIGSTYMTCVGLSPVQKCENDVWQNLKTCVDLGFEMQKALREINNHSFNNNFQLRIGINQGPVVAGVIGARKPHYDIWGHTVNLASRMESTGVPQKTQVLESTAKILRSNGYDCAYRATIHVKGLDDQQKVYTVIERQRSINPVSMRRGSIQAHTFDNVVMKLLSNPAVVQKLMKDSMPDPDY